MVNLKTQSAVVNTSNWTTLLPIFSNSQVLRKAINNALSKASQLEAKNQAVPEEVKCMIALAETRRENNCNNMCVLSSFIKLFYVFKTFPGTKGGPWKRYSRKRQNNSVFQVQVRVRWTFICLAPPHFLYISHAWPVNNWHLLGIHKETRWKMKRWAFLVSL